MSDVEKAKWKSGQHKGVDPGDALAVIEEIRETSGGFATSAAIVDAARAKGSVLHPLFEWDDTVAAEKFRLRQAGEVVRNLEIEVITSGYEKPAYYSVSYINEEKSVRGYTTEAVVLENPALRDSAVQEALNNIRGWVARYGHLKDMSPISAAVKKVEKTVK